MAEFQFVGGPWALDKKHQPNIAYASTLDLLAWPHGKKRIMLKETKERAALVLQRSKQAAPTIQPFVMVGSVVNLTTPTKITRREDTLETSSQTYVGHPQNETDLRRRNDVMDLTTPSSTVQAKATNDETDFLLQDTDEEEELGGFKDRKQEFKVNSDVTIPPSKLLVTQSQVTHEVGNDHLARKNLVESFEKPTLTIETEVEAQATLEEPILLMETDVRAGAVDESTAKPDNESVAEDDPDKVTVKRLESFDAKRLRIPKRRQEANNEIFKRLRLDTDDDEMSKSTENQKKRARDVPKRQKEEDKRQQALAGSRV